MDASAAASSASSAQQQQQQQRQQQQSPPQQQPHQQQAVAPSGGPQVRSRITVVCAECKRLKLKCDRKTPCGSCEKRDTIARCIYSPAAAEKVDLHSLNNRLSVVEAQLSQISYGNARSCNHHGSSGSGFQPSDRALIAVGQSGSSLTIPLEDVTAIWLDQLDLNKDILPALTPSNSSFGPSTAPYSPSQIKLERSPNHLHSENANCELPAALLLPPLSIYYPLNSRTYQPSITTELVALLPSSRSRRRRLCNSVEEILTINPCFIWKHFRERMDGMFRWAEDMEIIERIALESRSGSGGTSKADAARATFFGESGSSDKVSRESKPTLSFFAAAAGALAVGAQANRDQNGNGFDEDNAMAVDEIVLHGGGASSRSVSSSSQAKKARTTVSTQSYPTPNMDNSRSSASPTLLFALSEQALDIFEKSNTYDLDYLVALVMQALYMLHGGKPVVDHRLYPLIGKMVNVARLMGLAMDPDEFPGKYSLFEAETRRRIWWDVFCYDLYVSDSMGHPPTIPDNSFTTKMPVDVDESSFSPSSTSIPTPSTDDHTSRYFGLKLRMAQIVKSVKKRTFKDPLMDSPSSDSASIEEAASFEGEVTQFLVDLPLAFKLEIDADLSTLAASVSSPSPFSSDSPERSSSSACLIAQQCELVITGQRLILKIYLPFLRPNHTGATCNTNNHQAAVGTINAAHAIIYASRVLHAICKQSPGSQSKRPGPAIFDYYSFGQALFDAAVVCAHSVIMQPSAIWARVALDDVADALEVMKDPVVATGRGSLQASVEGYVSEPVKIIEMLKKKADGVRAGNNNSPSNSGSKRKHSEVDTRTDHLAASFQLPYVGPAVASAGPATGSSPGSSAQASSPPDGTQSDGTALSNGSEGSGRKRLDAEKAKVKNKKDRRAQYPVVGIRVRPGKESPAVVRHRERAHSTASTASLTETDTRMQASNSLSSVSHVSAPTPTTSHHSFIPITQAPSPKYQSPPSVDSMQPPTQQEAVHNSHNEYPPSFANADNSSLHMNLSSMHQYTIQEASAQHGYSSRPPNQMPVYDQNHCNTYMNAPSPTSFRPGSSGQLPNGSSSFSEGPVGMSSQHQPTPFAHSHVASTQPYEPPASNPSSAYFAHPPYQSNFDNGGQGPLRVLTMDNTGGTNGPLTPSPNDMMFDVKPQNGNHLQQPFSDVRGQVQGWQQDNGGGGSGTQFWQPGYKPYFSA